MRVAKSIRGYRVGDFIGYRGDSGWVVQLVGRSKVHLLHHSGLIRPVRAQDLPTPIEYLEPYWSGFGLAFCKSLEMGTRISQLSARITGLVPDRVSLIPGMLDLLYQHVVTADVDQMIISAEYDHGSFRDVAGVTRLIREICSSRTK